MRKFKELVDFGTIRTSVVIVYIIKFANDSDIRLYWNFLEHIESMIMIHEE